MGSRICDSDILVFLKNFRLPPGLGVESRQEEMPRHRRALSRSECCSLVPNGGERGGESLFKVSNGCTPSSTRWRRSSLLLLQPTNHTCQLCINTRSMHTSAYIQIKGLWLGEEEGLTRTPAHTPPPALLPRPPPVPRVHPLRPGQCTTPPPGLTTAGPPRGASGIGRGSRCRRRTCGR